MAHSAANLSISKNTFHKAVNQANIQIHNAQHQNEEPFRVLTDNPILYRDKELQSPEEDVDIDKEAIVSAKYMNNNVVFIGEPYNLFISANDIEPVDIKRGGGGMGGHHGGGAPMQFGNVGNVDIIDEDEEEEYTDDANNLNANDGGGGGSQHLAPSGHANSETVLIKKDYDMGSDMMMSDNLSAATGDFDEAPRSFESPKPQDFVNNNNNNNRNPRFQQHSNNNGTHANAALHGMSYKDENGLEQHIGLSQDYMLSSVLGPGPQAGRGMNGAPGPRAGSPHGSTYSVGSHHSGRGSPQRRPPHQQQQQHNNNMPPHQQSFQDVQMGHRRTGSQVSSHS